MVARLSGPGELVDGQALRQAPSPKGIKFTEAIEFLRRPLTQDDDRRLALPPDRGWSFNPGGAGTRLRQVQAMQEST